MLKKVIKLDNDKFVKNITSMSVLTCNHIKDAYDISSIPLDVVFQILNHLTNIGIKPSIVEVKNNG